MPSPWQDQRRANKASWAFQGTRGLLMRVRVWGGGCVPTLPSLKFGNPRQDNSGHSFPFSQAQQLCGPHLGPEGYNENSVQDSPRCESKQRLGGRHLRQEAGKGDHELLDHEKGSTAALSTFPDFEHKWWAACVTCRAVTPPPQSVGPWLAELPTFSHMKILMCCIEGGAGLVECCPAPRSVVQECV
jgi:hypothetical protein